MTISQVVDQITREHQAMLIRPRTGNPAPMKGPQQYDVKPLFSGRKKGWTILDGFTAGAMKAVYNALNETNRERWDSVPLPALLSLTWKHIK